MIDLKKALFWDIETHAVNKWNELTPAIQKAFINHNYDPQSYSTPEEHYSEIAGLYAEFSHVICVVFGYLDNVTYEFKTFAVYGIDEVDILKKCKKIFDQFQNAGYFLVDFNGTTCDRPYMTKRYIINGLIVPDFINSYGVKPWDQVHVDVMDLWKFGDYKRTSLEMVCACLGIPCKTDEIGGDNMYQYDIEEMPWEQLVHYCTEDVVSLYQATKKILEFYET